MADFGENFRGPRPFVVCPFLCNQRDSQSHVFSCQSTIQLELNGKYDDVFKENIPISTGYSLTKINKMRKKFFEENNISIFSSENPNRKRKKS